MESEKRPSIYYVAFCHCPSIQCESEKVKTLWYTSRLPVWQDRLSFSMSLRSLLSRMTSLTALWASLPGGKPPRPTSGGMGGWQHSWYTSALFQEWMFAMWRTTESHISLRSCLLPPHSWAQMIWDGLYPGKDITAALLAVFCQFLGQVPDGELVFLLRMIPLHVCCNTDVSVTSWQHPVWQLYFPCIALNLLFPLRCVCQFIHLHSVNGDNVVGVLVLHAVCAIFGTVAGYFMCC